MCIYIKRGSKDMYEMRQERVNFRTQSGDKTKHEEK